MPPLSVRDVASLLLIPLLFYLFLWFWLDSDPDLQPGLFDFEDDEFLGRETNPESNPDVVDLDGVADGEFGVSNVVERVLCPKESFKLATMENCLPWLGCKEITDEVIVHHMLGQGAVKQSGRLSFQDNGIFGRKKQGKVKESKPKRNAVDVAEGELRMDKLEERGLCPPGSFRLPTMETCMPWLGCKEITNEVTIRHRLKGGMVKKFYKATWRGHAVGYNNVTNTERAVIRHFLNDVEMLRKMQQSPHVVQLVGSCHTTLLTEYYRFGHAGFIEKILNMRKYSKFNNVRTRFNTAMSYLEAIHFLHNSPVGTRVMCDTNYLQKTLTQFLVSEDFKLVLCDLDDIPEVNSEAQLLVKCKTRNSDTDFVAPEQLWPFENETFDDSRMPPYDEKTDIWKIPTVVDYLLGNVNGSDVVRSHLFKVHQQCKNRDPKQRPSAKVLLEEYKRARSMLFPE
uniref:Protein O-mannose kinase n=1 Tax=Branchiostoma floridae TaxID=7739 RepID=C3Y478_BRAFL|eukprot:XP_002609094.1 hypothetical protein BRAFLDRAFT_91067 [Branchiostoma floridae]